MSVILTVELSGLARSLILAGHLLYVSSLLSRFARDRVIMSGTNRVVWPTCPARAYFLFGRTFDLVSGEQDY